MASERIVTRFGFREVIERGAADFIMPDLAWCGGLSEGKKVAVLVSTRLLPIAPHNCGGPVNHVVNTHYCASIPNLLAMESIRAFYLGFYEDLVTAVPVPVNGRIRPPQAPGLGVELHPDLLARSDLVRQVTEKGSKASSGLAGGDPWATEEF